MTLSRNATQRPVRVEIWSDVQCIWCYIAGARFRKAVARFEGDVEITYRSFELTPDAPIEIDREAQIRKHGTERIEQVLHQLTKLTSAEGLPYDPDHTQPTNSHLALELLHHADTLGERPALTQRLFEAFFAEGRHIGHIDELVDLAMQVGLGADSARHVLVDRRYAPAVDADVQRARALGANGVPFFVINDTLGLSGAQPTETFMRALEQAATQDQ